jgi:hypothetical protein
MVSLQINLGLRSSLDESRGSGHCYAAIRHRPQHASDVGKFAEPEPAKAAKINTMRHILNS